MADFSGWRSRFRQVWISIRHGFISFFSWFSKRTSSESSKPHQRPVHPKARISNWIAEAEVLLDEQNQAQAFVDFLWDSTRSKEERLGFLARLEQEAQDECQSDEYRAVRLKALSYFYGHGSPQELSVWPNREKALGYKEQVLEWWLDHERCLEEALRQIGSDLAKGRHPLGFFVLLRAAEMGNSTAWWILGCYLQELKVHPTVSRAYYRQAAIPGLETASLWGHGGSCHAQWYLSLAYQKGEGYLAKDLDMAAYYAYLAAIQGDGPAQAWLAEQVEKEGGPLYLLLQGLLRLEKHYAAEMKKAGAEAQLHELEKLSQEASGQALALAQPEANPIAYAECYLERALNVSRTHSLTPYQQGLKDALCLRLGHYYETQALKHRHRSGFGEEVSLALEPTWVHKALSFYLKAEAHTKAGQEALFRASHLQHFVLGQTKDKKLAPFSQALKAAEARWSSLWTLKRDLKAMAQTSIESEAALSTTLSEFESSSPLQHLYSQCTESDPKAQEKLFLSSFMEEYHMFSSSKQNQVPLDYRQKAMTRLQNDFESLDKSSEQLLRVFIEKHKLHAPSPFEQGVEDIVNEFEQILNQKADESLRKELYDIRKTDVERIRGALLRTKRTIGPFVVYDDQELVQVCEEIANDKYGGWVFFSLYLNDLCNKLNRLFIQKRNNEIKAHQDLRILPQLEQALSDFIQKKNVTEKQQIEAEKKALKNQKEEAEKEIKKLNENIKTLKGENGHEALRKLIIDELKEEWKKERDQREEEWKKEKAEWKREREQKEEEWRKEKAEWKREREQKEEEWRKEKAEWKKEREQKEEEWKKEKAEMQKQMDEKVKGLEDNIAKLQTKIDELTLNNVNLMNDNLNLTQENLRLTQRDRVNTQSPDETTQIFNRIFARRSNKVSQNLQTFTTQITTRNNTANSINTSGNFYTKP